MLNFGTQETSVRLYPSENPKPYSKVYKEKQLGYNMWTCNRYSIFLS